MAEQDLDRNQPATQHKLDEARRKGQAAKSADLVSAMVFGVAMLYFHAGGINALVDQFRLDRILLASAIQARGVDEAYWVAVIEAARHSVALALPVLVLIMVAAVLANFLQIGAIWSVAAIKPDWQRLNPATGLKRIFSFRILFETVRALIKLTLMGIVVYFSFRALVSQFHEIGGVSGFGFLKMLHADISAVGLKLSLALLAIAMIDLVYTRREFARKMRMSHREIKEEYKNREGDPRIRRRMRDLQRELLQRSSSIGRTRDASVLLTNPTHYAVALRYDHGEMRAPVMLAKGAGVVAHAMRATAARHGIPVIAMPKLTRALYAELRPDQPVGTDHYADVARVMIWVINMRQAQVESNLFMGKST